MTSKKTIKKKITRNTASPLNVNTEVYEIESSFTHSTWLDTTSKASSMRDRSIVRVIHKGLYLVARHTPVSCLRG